MKILYKNLKISEGTAYFVEYPPQVREMPMVKAFLSPSDIDYFKIKDVSYRKNHKIYDKDVIKFNISFPYVYLKVWKACNFYHPVLAFSKNQVKSGSDLLGDPIFPNILGNFPIGVVICLGGFVYLIEDIDARLWNYCNTQKFSLNRKHFFDYRDFYINPNLLFDLTNETFTVEKWLGVDPFSS